MYIHIYAQVNGEKTEEKNSAGAAIGRAQKEETVVDGSKNGWRGLF